jgi:hypothetical protein
MISVFCNVVPPTLADIYPSFEDTSCLHFTAKEESALKLEA